MSMICLIDCDNFFASCEKLFHPEFRNKPLVVCSGENGIIIARSKEAKALNIPMCGACFEYKSLFIKEDVIIRGTNFALYSDISSRIRETVATFGLEMFVYSVDEMFLKIPSPLVCDELLENIQQKIKQWVGIDVSIGLSKTKTLAKIATKKAKALPTHRKIFVEDFTTVLKNFPVEDVWGIGEKLKRKLHQHQCKNAGDLMSLSDDFLHKLLGVNGCRIKKELGGENAYPFFDKVVDKSMQITKTFPVEIISIKTVNEILSSFISEGCERLRKIQKKAGELTIFFQSSRFKDAHTNFVQSYTLDESSHYTPDFLYFKEQALSILRDGDIRVKRAGIYFNMLTPEAITQQNFFSNPVSKNPKLMTVIDQINGHFGSKTIRFASQSKTFSRKLTKSRRYTTNWEEILEVFI